MNSLNLITYCFFILMILSCKRSIIFKNKSIDTSCKELIQDIIDHTVKIDTNYIDFKVLDKEKTKKEAYIDFSQNMLFRLGERREACLATFNKDDILRQFGKPNNLRSKNNNWFYVYRFGVDCPCTNCHPSNLYGACNYINFRFDNSGKLIYLFIDTNGMQWE